MPDFLRLIPGIDLNKTLYLFLLFIGFSSYCSGDLWPVNSMYDVKKANRLSCFI